MKGLEDVECATLEWVAWYKSQRLMESICYLPPAKYEEQYRRVQSDQSALADNQPSLWRTRGETADSFPIRVRDCLSCRHPATSPAPRDVGPRLIPSLSTA